jgi:hypothetical protein
MKNFNGRPFFSLFFIARANQKIPILALGRQSRGHLRRDPAPQPQGHQKKSGHGHGRATAISVSAAAVTGDRLP